MSLSKSKPSIDRQLDLPAVVACGYRRVQIPKSGNTFPALLVAFEAETEGKRGCGSSATDNVPKPLRFAWRSKKDFLLLARKGVESNEKSLPKAAFKRLVDETTAVPWRRPSEDTKNATEQTRLNNIAIPDCLSNNELPNHYSVRMKKSILQLDTFLQTMESKANESPERQTAWDFFSRDSDTEDLVALETSSTVHDSTSSPSSTAALRESSRLGQYFASKENAHKVADYALEKMLAEYRRNPDTTDWDEMTVFVEPSCGHGDIIVSLIDSLQRNKRFCPDHEYLWIIGFDIDPAAIEICRKRKEFTQICTRTFPGNRHETHICKSGDYTIFLECSSFFEISPEDCVRRLQQYHHECYVQQLYKYKTVVFESLPVEGLKVCCLGGPPYTTGQGSGGAMKRDLPEKFVDHCYNEWKADVICFLLPDRYREDANISTESAFLATKPPTPGLYHGADDAWIRETHELEASKFFFRGTTEVTQPSIIKRLYRSQTSDDGYFGYKADGTLDRAEDWLALAFKKYKA